MNYEIKKNPTMLWDTLKIDLPDNIGSVMLFKDWKYLYINCEELFW